MPVIRRDDLSARLAHLTRGATGATSAAFLSIVRERRLRAGDTGIRGGYRCVCFSEAPLGKLAHLLADPSVECMRYKPFGVMVDKTWLFDRGGRPVIYQPEAEFEMLPESHRYRHVRYDPPHTDHTWEREYRVRVDELPLDPRAVTLMVPTRPWERYFLRRHERSRAVAALVLHGLAPGGPFPWHFTVLEDVGVDLPNVPPPPK